MKRAILFDLDLGVKNSPVPWGGGSLLSPLTDLRAAFDVRTGATTTLERWSRMVHVDGLLVCDGLRALTRERHPHPVNERPVRAAGAPDDVLLISGRCVPVLPEVLGLGSGAALIEKTSGHLIAWRTTEARMTQLRDGEMVQPETVSAIDRRVLLTRPWHVRTLRDNAIAADLAAIASAPTAIPPGVTPLGSHPIHIDPSARISPTVVLDAENGPIWIGPHSVVRPGAILIGPCALGEHSTVLDRTLIKGQTAIGPHCKVAGEIGGTIIQGHSNKAHDGHLGDSWLGEWVNLGAGTTNSNLLNTYGEVIAKAMPGGQNERTGETFLGAIIGDHVKAAICTRLMTGTVLHTGSMFAQTAAVSGTVGAFTWATDEGHKPYRHAKFVDVAKAAMARRKVNPSEAYVARLQELNAAAR